MKQLKMNKAFGLTVIAAVYILVSAAGIRLYGQLPYPMWVNLLISDSAATLITFIFSLLWNNASVYDPYWSVAPIVIITAFVANNYSFASPGVFFKSAAVPLLFSVWIWGVRLTANWVYTFRGLHIQDWRYNMLKEKAGVLYPAVNLLGIHMFPTLIVYLCVLPAVYAIETGAAAVPMSYIGTAVCVFAVMIQSAADIQMHGFRKRGTGGLIREGLWKYSRHPNYLGEILMWWGVALQSVSVLPGKPYLFAGAAANTAMFLFISIPMADKRQARKSGYNEYREATRCLLPVKKILPDKESDLANAGDR